MAKELTRNGVVGLELTREEVIDAAQRLRAIERKAQCREANCDIIDMLEHAAKELDVIDEVITDILDSDE